MRILCVPILLTVVAVTPVLATAGFAEWEVYTPGGNLISRTDVRKAQHGTCLRSDAQPDAGKAQIYASQLVRWRYYEGVVAGEDDERYFLFVESDGAIVRFGTEDELRREVGSRGLSPLSGWLGPGDGWHEAWFPFMVWRPCKIVLGEGESVTAGLSAAEIDRLREAASGMYTPPTPAARRWTKPASRSTVAPPGGVCAVAGRARTSRCRKGSDTFSISARRSCPDRSTRDGM